MTTNVTMPTTTTSTPARLHPPPLSVGSSPATYGMAMVAAVCLPYEGPVGSAILLPTWINAALVLVIPKFLGDKYVNVATDGVLRVIPKFLACAAACYVVLPGAAQYFFFYLYFTLSTTCKGRAEARLIIPVTSAERASVD